MNSFFVYILRCSDGSYYTGHTDDLEKRISEHKNQSYTGYTCLRLPVELVYHATFTTRDEALLAERKIKGWSRAKKQALIDNDFTYIKHLAQRRNK
jgi:Predicted endonuclease containing a URI domain